MLTMNFFHSLLIILKTKYNGHDKIVENSQIPSYLLNDFHIRVDVTKKETRCKPNHIKFFENRKKNLWVRSGRVKKGSPH